MHETRTPIISAAALTEIAQTPGRKYTCRFLASDKFHDNEETWYIAALSKFIRLTKGTISS